MTTELPPALRPWAESLGFLTVDAALHIGPLVRRLDALVRRHDAADARTGVPDGYGGLSLRGHPERLLLSEWLLAEELPLEFIRRAANNELLYVAPAFRASAPEGRVAVFCDVGPDQLGAARLVQLAALIVLHRRARTRGTELVVGVSGGTGWHAGGLPELYAAWRAAREPLAPTAAELEERLSTLDAADELWVLAGDALAEAGRKLPLLLHTRESAWDAEGVTAVEVRFEGRATTLALPGGPVSVAALRGAALRRVPRERRSVAMGALRCPTFPASERRLLLRGEEPEELLVLPMPTTATGGEARPRLHRFAHPVVSATFYSRRLVVLLLDGDRLRCEVVGKRLARVEQIEVPLEDLDLDAGTVDLDVLPPLFFDSGSVLCRIGDAWWRLSTHARASREDDVVAVGPGPALDSPYTFHRVSERLLLYGGRDLGRSTGAVLAGESWSAWEDGGVWQLADYRFRTEAIPVPADDTVLGRLYIAAAQGLVTLDASDTVWLRTPTSATPVGGWSGPGLDWALHPRLPLLAVQRSPELVEVIEYGSSDPPVEVRAG
ncbi:hypothetical protein DVA67_006170 [Solirubrobacter sp. CPCC 204708]|uniref:Uncharacterized protein n=1 Tax=Solirubrobacter deserti TaxID=2282478 RepID=A0ABT4RCR8_9ACTN|nr:hypothetical protein [Solirubrobacter deserti]MBE2315553.1 hypothetical protein [Solirubrobacter deserti]MDA0136191.1 hypothetical protein [Solirubrobacter deserti]